MKAKNEYVAHYHGANSKEGISAAWVLFYNNPLNGKLEEEDYGDDVLWEPKGAIANTACFIAASKLLEHFLINYQVEISKLTISGCNKIVALQIAQKFKIGEGSYTKYAHECLNLVEQLKDNECEFESVFEKDGNKAKELAILSKVK